MGAIQANEIAAAPPIVFRMSPAARRCGFYMVAGVAAVAGLWGFLYAHGLRNGPRATACIAGVFGLPLLAFGVLALRYRVGVAKAGVWQRFFIRWDLWPWEAFSDGRIRTGSASLELEFPTKRWTHRRLVLPVFLTYADLDTLSTRIRQVLPTAPPPASPPPPALPETMTIRYDFGEHLELSRNGLRLVRSWRDEERSYGWSSVLQVRTLRASRSSRDFSELEVDLPQLLKPIRLKVVGSSRGWRGPSAEVLAHYLERHVSPERFVVTASSGPPRDIAEADRMLAGLDRPLAFAHSDLRGVSLFEEAHDAGVRAAQALR